MPDYRKLLFLCDLGQASPRVLGLARELALLGVDTFIVTPSLTSAQRERLGIEKSENWTLLPIPRYKMSYKRNVGIRRFLLAPSRIIKRYMNRFRIEFIDEKRLADQIYKKLKTIRNLDNFLSNDMVIISSSGPFRYHIVASQISHQAGGTWVADYRDMWSLNHAKKAKLDPLQLEFEKFIIGKARGITTVSDDLVASSREIFTGPILELQNGHPGYRLEAKAHSSALVITYTGQIYKKYQRLDLFLQGLMLFEPEELKGRLEVRFAGESVREVKDYFRTKGVPIPPYIFLLGNLGRDASLKLQSQSSFLLAFKWDDNIHSNLFSTKIYEYISSGRPTIVFGSTPNEALGKLVKKANAGVELFTPDDIHDFISLYLDGLSYSHKPDLDVIENLSYKNLAKSLDGFLKSL